MTHQLVITARSPLVFSDRKPNGQFTRSLPYIPGGVLWGALGAQLGATPSAFFSHALPMEEGDKWVRVLPATAMSCKAHSGFLNDPPHPKRGSPHGLFDTLIDRICWEELEPAAITYNPHCPHCQERATTRSGVYAANGDGMRQSRGVHHRILTRVAIDRQRSTAAEGQLYSPIAITEGSRFVGWVEGLDETSRERLGAITALGARTSSGLGHVCIKVCEEADSGLDPIEKRLHEFHRRFADRWQLFEDHLLPQNPHLEWNPRTERLFSVGLQSDALLWEEGWMPTMTFSEAQFKAETGIAARLVRAQARSLLSGGWNVSWNRPKESQVAVAAGSVFVFRSQATEAEIGKALKRLEQTGIGQRRAEGYGRVLCCDPFHVEALGGRI